MVIVINLLSMQQNIYITECKEGVI